MRIRATAPTRIDLAGGTLDIWPLYLFEEGGITVNLAIDVESRVEVTTRDDSEVHLSSRDTGAERHAPSLEALPTGGDLDLVARAVRFYRPKVGVDVHTENLAPRGSGLGASSSLLIALSGALARLDGRDLSPQRIIDIAANLEAQTITIPTGKQDYYAAMFGGANAIRFGVDADRVERLVVSEEVLAALERRLLLSFTGYPRPSAATNWNMLKAYVEDHGSARANLRRIKRTALDMREALLSADMEAFGTLLRQEWDNRRTLAEGVTTPAIDELIAAAEQAGAVASKLCGAGGGGCLVTLVRDGRRAEVARALEERGARVMQFAIARNGLTVSVS